MPELNTLRGLACLAVLFFHGFWWYIPRTATGLEGWLRDATQGGYRGVSLFFVLSGLLITNILLESRSRLDYFSRFYKRRAMRILPPYYMLLGLLAIYGTPPTFLGISLLHAANMAPYFGIVMGYGSLWSLGVEEQFYFVWPLLVRWLSIRALIVVACGVFVNSILLSLALHTSSPQATMPIWHAAHGLAFGALLSIFLRSQFGARRNAIAAGGTLTIAGVVMLLFCGYTKDPVTGTMQGVAWDFLFAATLLFALLIGTSRYEALIRPKLLLFFGDISYGLYLIHVLTFMVYWRILHTEDGLQPILVQFLICASVSIAVATLSRFTIEEWFLARKDRPWNWKFFRRPASPALEHAS